MKRRPVERRPAPAYPDCWAARLALGLLALSSVGLVGCDALTGCGDQNSGNQRLAGAPPVLHVDGEPVAPDPEPVVDPDVHADPVILEVEDHPVPVPAELEPLPGEPVAPAERPVELPAAE